MGAGNKTLRVNNMNNRLRQFWRYIRKMWKIREYGKINHSVDDKVGYREFKTASEAEEWGMKHYLNWAKQYKKSMKLAENTVKTSLCTAPIECYCGYSYKQINNFLRNGLDSEGNLYRELADILSIVLCNAPKIPCDIVVYRFVNSEFISELIKDNKEDMPFPIQEKGFMSTSLIKDIVNQEEPYATSNNLLKIYVEKGTIGVYVNAVTKRSEEEMLLFPNMYLGLIDYPYHDKDSGKTIYECKLIKFY